MDKDNEAPMDEWVEPIREPVIIHATVVPVSSVGRNIFQLCIGILAGIGLVCILL